MSEEEKDWKKWFDTLNRLAGSYENMNKKIAELDKDISRWDRHVDEFYGRIQELEQKLSKVNNAKNKMLEAKQMQIDDLIEQQLNHLERIEKIEHYWDNWISEDNLTKDCLEWIQFMVKSGTVEQAVEIIQKNKKQLSELKELLFLNTDKIFLNQKIFNEVLRELFEVMKAYSCTEISDEVEELLKKLSGEKDSKPEDTHYISGTAIPVEKPKISHAWDAAWHAIEPQLLKAQIQKVFPNHILVAKELIKDLHRDIKKVVNKYDIPMEIRQRLFEAMKELEKLLHKEVED